MLPDWNEGSYGEPDWSLAIYVEVFDWLAVSVAPAPTRLDVQDFCNRKRWYGIFAQENQSSEFCPLVFYIS